MAGQRQYPTSAPTLWTRHCLRSRFPLLDLRSFCSWSEASNVVEDVGKALTDMLVAGGMQHCTFISSQVQKRKRWYQALWDGPAGFLFTNDCKRNGNVALACFQYKTRVCRLTNMTPSKAVFGVAAWKVQRELETVSPQAKPENISGRLGQLHQKLYSENEKFLAR